MTDGGLKTGGKGDWSGRLLDGRYRVERVLGAGGMGTVYLARDERMQRPVVVKVPHARLLDDEQFRARFAKEIRSLTSLPHPHVVKVLDAGETRDDARAADDPPTPFAVLEFLEGGSLKDKLERTPQSPEEVIGWLPDVAKALDFIHGQGVVHRDIKPGNVLFDRTGNAVVADFGIAKALGTLGTGLTRTGFTPGSPPYMGPEVGMGLPLGPGYDEYALGVLVYEALSGALPHEGTSGEVLIAKKAYVEPIDLKAKAPNVPAAARAAVMKAIARKPEDRFASCRAFAEAFVHGVHAPTPAKLEAAPPPPPPKFPAESHRPARGSAPESPSLPSPARRRLVRPALAVAVVALLILVGVLAMALWGGAPPTGDRRTTMGELVVETPVEGALLASVKVDVAGLAGAPPGVGLSVEGESVAVVDGRFSTTLTLPPDGERTIEVRLRSPSTLEERIVRRTVVIDTTKPVVEITKPASRTATFPASTASATIAGRLLEAHPKSLRVGAAEVAVSPDGTFEATIPLVEGTQAISIVATDAAGLVSDPATVTLVRETAPPPAPARAIWADDVSAATSSALSDDMPAASSAWDRAVGKGAGTTDAPPGLLPRIAKWKAPPELVVTEPDDGARVTANPLRVRGELRAGRATDEVLVDGTVVRTGPGPFETSVTLSRAGTNSISILVRDGSVARGSEVVRRVVYAPPTTAPYEAYLRGFAVAVGPELDATTGYPKKIRRLKDDGEMVLIPAGTFQMGAVPGDSEASGDEKPRHAVTLTKAYYLDVNEVTVGQWKKFVSGGGGRMPTDLRSEATDRHPIHRVDHAEMTSFATWAGASLPTEAQWERAAKGGHDDFVYPWGATDDVKKRNGDGSADGFDGLAPVRSFPPNDYGLYDLSGNVWDWCSDWNGDSYYAASPNRDPSGPGSGSSRLARGGSCFYHDVALRASDRYGASATTERSDYIGFRLARNLPAAIASVEAPPSGPNRASGGVSAPEAFFKDFAVAVGTEIDAGTGYPKKIRRMKDDGEMVLIPAGTFQMGAVPGDSNASSDEKPRHAVTLTKAYYLDVNEVTVEQWMKFVAGDGGRMPTDLLSESTGRHPIHNVNHTEATWFAAWVGAALPTEAQWERAAKGGHEDFVYPWGGSADVRKRNGVGSDDGFAGLAPVRSYPPNDYGLYDMSGSVWEWCSDWFDKSYYAASPGRDPTGPGSGSDRAARGGSWGNNDDSLRASFRYLQGPSDRYAYVGFRLARSLPTANAGLEAPHASPDRASGGVWAPEAFLKDFAIAVGTDVDAATGYPKKIRRLKDDGEMVLIPAGTFQMGAGPSDKYARDDEKPRHAVTLTKAYYLDVNEVTVGQWKKFVAGGAGRMPTGLRREATDRHPIHNVDHAEATAFATWVGASLPTEAQWERAAKGGHDDFVYPWGASDDVKQRNGREDNDGSTALAPVRSFYPNHYGLYDMSGNVWEWCADWIDSSYYAASPGRNPAGPGSGSARAVRGGSWFDYGVALRASFRGGAVPTLRDDFSGLRLVRSL